MKKILIFMGLLLGFNLVTAAPSGNPSFPSVIKEGFFISPSVGFNFRLGYEGNFVSDRKLKQEIDSDKRINKFSHFLNSGTCTLTFLDRLDVFATYGKGYIKANWIKEENENEFSYIEIETKDKIAWSVGTKIIFFEWGDTSLSAGGSYSYTEPNLSWYSIGPETFKSVDNKIKYDQLQATLGISHKIDMFYPYIAAKYSKAKAELNIKDVSIGDSGSNFLKMESKDLFGLVLGCSFSSEKYFMLNLEVSMIDEQAFSVSCDFKF
jgi:hypothetical protein